MGYTWTISTTPPNVPTTPAEEEQAKLLGADVFFDDDYRVTPHGDYLIVTGLDALKQYVRHFLATNPGEYKLRPDWGGGARAMVAKRSIPGEIDAAKLRWREGLLKHPFIDDVDFSVEDITDGIRVGIFVTAKGQALKPFSVDVPEGA